MHRLLWLALILLLSCGRGAFDVGTDDVETDTDTDTDTDADTDADADTDSCVDEPVWSDGGCPPECDRCVDRACVMDCNGLNDCTNSRIDCPEGWHCMLECGGINACANLVLRCPDQAPCDVGCDGVNACANARVTCPETASCDASCGGASACVGGQLDCGPKGCFAVCGGIGADLDVRCNDSCDCENGC